MEDKNHNFIIGMRVDLTSYEVAVQQIKGWQQKYESRYICAANVHMVMETRDSEDFRTVVNRADIITPDGMPLVWILRIKGFKRQQRVYGPTLMLHVLEMAARENIPVGFYGGNADTLKKLVNRMQASYPGLNVVYSYSPPFRDLTYQENEEICQQIQSSGVRILFVGLGCPKQERWMAEHRDRICAIMLGVGAAFDFHAGVINQAPSWMQGASLEWLYRFIQEPARLWKRYFFQNPRFVVLALGELLGILKNPD